MKTRFLILASIALSFGACDKIEQPLDDGASLACDPAIVVPRKILIEDLTGHLCVNCPAAAKTAEEIADFYDLNAVVVAIHVTPTFARPLTTMAEWQAQGVPNGSFTTDFRTEAGDALLAAYPVSGLPAGLISRFDFNGSAVLGAGTWFAAASQIVCKEADALVVIDNVSLNSTNGNYSADVSVQARTALNGDHRLTVYLTEDHILDWQLDSDQSPSYVPDYDHRHVLRDKIDGGGSNSVLGELLFSSASSGDIFPTTVSGTISSDWNASNCALVAFISSPSGEVLQAEEIKIVP